MRELWHGLGSIHNKKPLTPPCFRIYGKVGFVRKLKKSNAHFFGLKWLRKNVLKRASRNHTEYDFKCLNY